MPTLLPDGTYKRGIKKMTALKKMFLLLHDEVDIEGCSNLEYLRIGGAKENEER